MKEFTLDQMVVTATRYEKKAVDIGASTQVFDQKKLKETGATNLFEALQYGTGLNIQQYGTGGASMGNMTSKITIRGNGNGTLVLLNGVPLNIRGTYDLNDIPVENIERVEIVRGGGSVLYGSEATGGVINIITKKERNNFISAAVGNYGQQQYTASVQAGNLGFGYKYSKWGNVDDISISRTDNEDRKNWKGPENNNFDLTYKFNNNLSLQASHNESTYNYITTKDAVKMGKLTPANDTRQDVKRNNIQLTYDDGSFRAVGYYLDRKREKNAVTVNEGLFYNSDDETSKNYGLDIQKDFEIKNGSIIVGATYQKENYESADASQEYKAGLVPDGGIVYGSTDGNQSRNNYSIYAQFDKEISDRDSINIAARETWTGSAPNDNDFSNFSSQAQYVHKLDDNQSLYASVGQSFKMPALYQIYKKGENGEKQNLEAQTGMHYELGWKKDISENKNIRVALFSYKIDDNISASWDDKSDKFTYTNENLRNTGIEAEYSVSNPKGFGYNIAATYGRPQTESIDKNGYTFGWQDDYNKLELKAGLTYRMEKWKAALNAAYMGGRKTYKTTAATTGSKPKPASIEHTDAKPYLLTNFNVEYQAQDDFSVFATFNNIFDRKDITYYSTSSEYYATPFNFMIGCKYTF